MKERKIVLSVVLSAVFIFTGCAMWDKTTKGTLEGTVASDSAGPVISRASDSNALKSITEAAVGGASGAVIGRQMDKQAEEINQTVPDVKVERVGEGIAVEFNNNVLFALDKSNLSDGEKLSWTNWLLYWIVILIPILKFRGIPIAKEVRFTIRTYQNNGPPPFPGTCMLRVLLITV
nr:MULTISPECIES: hypothetical protein [Maribellus]